MKELLKKNNLIFILVSLINTIFLTKYYFIFENYDLLESIILFLTLFIFSNYIMNKLYNSILMNNKLIILPLLYCFYFIFLGRSPALPVDMISKIVLFAITILFGFLYKKNEKKFTKFNIFIFILVSLLNAFLFVGHQIFLTSIHFELKFVPLIQYLLCTFWLIPFESTIIRLFYSKLNKKDNKKLIITWLINFLILTGIWLVCLYAFYPGNIMSDGIDQVLQALKVNTLTNNHPAIMAILMRCFFKLSYSVFNLAIFQVLFISAIISTILTYCVKQGVNKWISYIISLIFAILPNNYFFVTTIVKDTPYTIFLLILTFIIFKIIIEQKQFFQKWYNYILVPISLVLCCLFRHNGPGPFILTLTVFVFYAFKLKSAKPVIIMVSSVILLMIVKYPIYNMAGVKYNVDNSGRSISSFNSLVFRSSANILISGGTITPKVQNILERVMNEELAIKYFNKYNGDTYAWNTEITEYNKNLKNPQSVYLSDVIYAYSNNFLYHPYQVIKERADATNILWTVASPPDSYNHRYVYGVWYPNDYNKPKEKMDVFKINKKDEIAILPTSKLSNTLCIFKDWLTQYSVGDWILWRVGISWVIIFICMFALFCKKKEGLFIFIPVLANTLTYLPSLTCQIYRYVWYVFVVAFFIILFVKVLINNELTNETKKSTIIKKNSVKN